MRCVKCKFWGDGDGTGNSYDAGHVNECKHKLISGWQHASSASYDTNEISKVIVDGGGVEHSIVTRYNFGCVLFVDNGVKK
jgi:hypothetical protein